MVQREERYFSFVTLYLSFVFRSLFRAFERLVDAFGERRTNPSTFLAVQTPSTASYSGRKMRRVKKPSAQGAAYFNDLAQDATVVRMRDDRLEVRIFRHEHDTSTFDAEAFDRCVVTDEGDDDVARISR